MTALEAARELAERLAADIPLCRTRDEHVRVTARANEALMLYNLLNGAPDPQGSVPGA